ncbi:hypothetical protein D3C71_2131220 [compost metagenome]
MGQFGSADNEGEAAVLEQGDTVIDERRQGIAHALRHDDEAHRGKITVAQCLGRFHLSRADGAQA